jgi:hypothetical protein
LVLITCWIWIEIKIPFEYIKNGFHLLSQNPLISSRERIHEKLNEPKLHLYLKEKKNDTAIIYIVLTDLKMIRIFGIDIVYQSLNYFWRVNYLWRVNVCICLNCDSSLSKSGSSGQITNLSGSRSDQTVNFCIYDDRYSRQIWAAMRPNRVGPYQKNTMTDGGIATKICMSGTFEYWHISFFLIWRTSQKTK